MTGIKYEGNIDYINIANTCLLQNWSTQKLKVKLLSNLAKAPTKANPEDAGFDLYSTQDVVIKPGYRQVVSTGIAMEIPNGYVGLIWPRSGMSVKKGCDVLAGVIDAPYRGEIKVCLQNCDLYEDIVIKTGDKIAQILIQEIPHFDLIIVNELSETKRGENGFGSSGV
jgi:dUTP pyrophosphatase